MTQIFTVSEDFASINFYEDADFSRMSLGR